MNKIIYLSVHGRTNKEIRAQPRRSPVIGSWISYRSNTLFPYALHGWLFLSEQVRILSKRSTHLNCFAMINKKSECFQFITQENIDAQKVMEFLKDFSLKIRKETFLVLDNASVHRAKYIQERIPFGQKRGFFLFYLPPYSPHLNIAETIWRILKGQWIKPED